MFPLVGIPKTIASALASYRSVFCREAGFEHICRYVSGLLLSPNKTLQGIYNQVVWPQVKHVNRRAMHASIFESGWRTQTLMDTHRATVASKYRTKKVAPLGTHLPSGRD